MNALMLKALSRLPWFKMAQWLIAEAGWKADVGAWLAAENAWYLKLAAQLWGQMGDTNPELVKSILLGLLKARK